MKNKLFLTCKIISASSDHRFKHGAILVSGSRVIRGSSNRSRPVGFAHKYHKANSASLHAEIGCVLNISKEITKGCDIYVARILSDGSMTMSRPCEMCQVICKEMGIKRIFYTNRDGNGEVIKL